MKFETNLSDKQQNYAMLLLLCIILFSGILLVMQLKNLFTYTPVDAYVKSAEWESYHDNPDSSGFYVTYSYEVNGTTYETKTTTVLRNIHHKGKVERIRCNPNNPTELFCPSHLLFMSVVCGISILFLWGCYSNRRKEKVRREYLREGKRELPF